MPAASRVKICGINRAVAVDAATEAGADWIGFVFFPPSPRYVTPAQAASLSARAPASDQPGAPQRVGLFVDPTEAAIAAALDALKLDVLQLYTDAQRAAAMRSRFGVPVWRAVGVAGADDLPVALQGSDALLLDAKAPPAALRPGGNAQAFDWSMLAGWKAPGAWILAGGLTPANVTAAVHASGAPAIDVSSGVERSPGVKDPDLIRAFIAAARAA